MTRLGAGTDRTCDFHAQHSPAGALASFTCGRIGGQGGPGTELGGPVDGAVEVGYRDGSGRINVLPFYRISASEMERYVQSDEQSSAPGRRVFTGDDIVRDYGWGSDCFTASDLSYTIHTPFGALPEPACSSMAAQRDAYAPAVLMTVTLHNPEQTERELFLALNQGHKWLPLQGGLCGFRDRHGLGFAVAENDAKIFSAFSVEGEFDRDHRTAVFGLGATAGVRLTVPAGATRTLTVAVGWYLDGTVTIGKSCRYWYTRLFANLDDVLVHALARSNATIAAAAARDQELAASGLNHEQQFLIAHSTRSYYGSTQLLDDGGRARWVVNEGEYLMMNTFDLTVDMAFYEMRYHPWTLRNVLEQFATEYRYEDEIFDPRHPETRLPGGVAFTHDMGVDNCWSPEGRSSYEIEALDRKCFSHMTCEELVNWILCAGVYWGGTEDSTFLRRQDGLLRACLESLQRRDHWDDNQRDGIMTWESGRTWPGGEITTYDSLDHSLGQARNNLYLAVKCWSCYLVLEQMLGQLGHEADAASARRSAELACATIADKLDPELGFIPAVFEGRNESAIIPAIEGLIFPWFLGLDEALDPKGRYGALHGALRSHFDAILKPGVCLYDDGGWKLSSTADNSWKSKICLCQHVARVIMGVSWDEAEQLRHDRAHADWQRIGAADYACSDQFTSAVAKGSLYYPRIVTAALWLSDRPVVAVD
ncbi:MAG: beta-xylosidase [Planctomycetota bacterium]|jgi:hypothetical protein|nr:beta-xylosidase [Planctomycetota bacterium]